jgi:ketosteroid isomerase-like protein
VSEDNVEIVRELYRATAGGKMDASFEFLAPEVEFHLSGAFPDLGDVYRGHDEIRRLNDQLNAPWEEISLLPERIVDLGERVLVLCRFHAIGRDGIEVKLPFAHLWTLHDGQVVRMDAFSDQAAALEAAGLPE